MELRNVVKKQELDVEEDQSGTVDLVMDGPP